jgi:hypothetical protein
MKTRFAFVVALMITVIIGQPVFGQTKALDLISGQIKTATADLKRAEKKFDSEKARKIYELKKESRNQEIKGLRSNNPEVIDAAAISIKTLNTQVDSVSKMESNADVQLAAKRLYELQQEKASVFESELAAAKANAKPATKTATTPDSAEPTPVVAKIDPYDRKIPTRLTKLDRNQRSRSHATRVDEVLISRVENNANMVMTPAGNSGGYKVIFDNMYSSPVNFIARSISSSVKVAVMVDPGVMCTKYMLPGKYMVEIYINGVMSEQPKLMTIDGQECDYKGNLCFNYAFAPKFR